MSEEKRDTNMTRNTSGATHVISAEEFRLLERLKFRTSQYHKAENLDKAQKIQIQQQIKEEILDLVLGILA